MRSPIAALFWESWRLARQEALFRMALVAVATGLLLGVAGVRGTPPTLALFIGIVLSVSARWVIRLEGDRGGFPMPLGYVRPIPTWVLVGVPMSVVALTCAFAYLLPMAGLRVAFGVPFPLLPAAVVVAVAALLLTFWDWGTPSRALRVGGWFGTIALGMLLFRLRFPEGRPGNDWPIDRWPELFAFTPTTYGMAGVIALAAFAGTLWAVDRQRHGEAGIGWRRSGDDRPARNRSVLDRMVVLLRTPCPTSSPLAAEIWLEMKCRGVPLLGMGAAAAALIPVVLFVYARYGFEPAILPVSVLSSLPLMAILRSSVWGRRAQGDAYLTPWEAARPQTTGRLLLVKTVVTAGGLLAAWALIAASLWWSLPPYLDAAGFGMVWQGVAGRLPASFAGGLTLWIVLLAAAVGTAVAYLGVLQVHWLLRPWTVVGVALLVSGDALLLAFSEPVRRIGPVVVGHQWLVAGLIVGGTAWGLRRVWNRGLLTMSEAAAVTLVWAGAAVIPAALLFSGAAVSGVPMGLRLLLLSLMVLPLGGVAAGLLSYDAMRHR